MKKKTKIICLPFLIFAFMALAMPMLYAESGNITATAQINPIAPGINSIAILDTNHDVCTTLDVNKEYFLKVSIIEKNGMQDINSITANIYYAKDGMFQPAGIDKRSNYVFVWNNSQSGGTWGCTPGGYLNEAACTYEIESPYITSFFFVFKLDKTAMPSGQQKTWKAVVNIIDTASLNSTSESFLFDVNDYIEWSGIPAEVNLTTTGLDPESTWDLTSPISINATVISNTEVTTCFQASNLQLGSSLIEADNYFIIQATSILTGGTIVNDYLIAHPVPMTKTAIYIGVYDTQCLLDPSVKGYSEGNIPLISFIVDAAEGKLVPNIPAGTYVATWTFSLERGEGATA